MKANSLELKPIDLEFIQAAIDGDLTNVKACLAAGANLHAKADHEQLRSGSSLTPIKDSSRAPWGSAFLYAASRDRVEVCVSLYLEGSNPKEKNAVGEDLTHLAQDTRSQRLMLAAAAMGVTSLPGAGTTFRTAGLREAAAQRPLKAAVHLNIPALVLHVLEHDPSITDAEVKRGIASASKSSPVESSVVAMLRSWQAKKQAVSALTDISRSP